MKAFSINFTSRYCLHLDPASSLELPLSVKTRAQFEINFTTCYLFTGKKKELAYAFASFVNH